jgi:hypothetical protein
MYKGVKVSSNAVEPEVVSLAKPGETVAFKKRKVGSNGRQSKVKRENVD